MVTGLTPMVILKAIVTGLTRIVILKAITAASTTPTARLSLTTQTGITRTGIRSRTSRTRTLTRGPIPLIPMTGTNTGRDIATVDTTSAFGCDSISNVS